MKHVGISRSATPATRNEAMRRWKARKVGHIALTRTVANGCERRTVAERLVNTAQTPHPQSETGTLATHSGKVFSLYTQKFLHTEDFTQKRFQTQKFLHTEVFTHRQKLLYSKVLHTEAFETQTGRSFVTQKLSHREVLDTETFAQGSPYTDQH